MYDTSDICLLASEKQRCDTGYVHSLGRIARAVLQHAGAVDDGIDALEERPPLRGLGRGCDVDHHFIHSNKTGSPLLLSADRNNGMSLGGQAGGNG
jgi:hypothetical protein